MPWFKVDDSFWSHPKLSDLSHAAVSLWVRAGAYCAQHLTDGRVSAATVQRQLWTSTDAADELVAAGLWEQLEDGSGYQFHDWLNYQPTAEATEQKRAAARERVQRARAKKRATPDEGNAPVRANNDVTSDVRSQNVRSTPNPNPNPNPVTSNEVTTPPTPQGGSRRGSRLSADWRPDDDTVAKIVAACPGLDWQREHDVFVDYWVAQPGQRGTKVDWAATWRNWMRRAYERSTPATAPRQQQRATPTQRAQQTLDLASSLELGAIS